MAKKKKSSKTSTPSNEPVIPSDTNDDGLLDDLIAQFDSKDAVAQQETATVIQEVTTAAETEARSSKGRARFEARKLRKAAEHAAKFAGVDDKDADARLEKEAKDEEKAIKRVCDELNLVMHEINPDGHCLYAAIADQLRILNILPAPDAHYATTRTVAAKYMFTHPNDFVPFLPSVEGEDGVGATDAGMVSPREFERYCATVRDTGTWGGELEILALSKAFNVPIHVVQGGTPPVVIHDPAGGHAGNVDDKRAVRISYHRRMYGLGEHYNSLRPKSLSQQIKSFIS